MKRKASRNQVRTINVTFDNSTFKELSKAKGSMTWEEYILSSIRSIDSTPAPEVTP